MGGRSPKFLLEIKEQKTVSQGLWVFCQEQWKTRNPGTRYLGEGTRAAGAGRDAEILAGKQMGRCTHVPSELLLLVLPSVDSRLPWRVTRLRISTAMPVSVLRRMLLRSFLVAPSGVPIPRREREKGQNMA